MPSIGHDALVAAPSWPLAFKPQQDATAAAVTAQVWYAPPLIAAKPAPPDTSVGVRCWVVEPSPS